ncbi:MAG: Xaa-Pro aminopeptidase [Ignavibacteria bacterium]|nr:Xaa-Pro aminopeptidase [Ignavibacteria bacterium]
MTNRIWWTIALLYILSVLTLAQDRLLYQTHFPPEEFAEHRAKIFDKIGDNALAFIQGATLGRGFERFRQSNTFYYLSGVEVPHAYLILDGRNRRTTLYVPHRDEGKERGEGKMLSAEDAEMIKELTGIDDVYGTEFLAKNLRWTVLRPPFPVLYTPKSPAEGKAGSRDELLGANAAIASDPWDGRPTREGHLVQLLKSRFPQLEIRDLSPVLDELRITKSPREIKLIRRASQIAGLGLMEAMRSTRPGVMEYQLEAAAKYIYRINDARREGYTAIVGGGTNAWMGHYFHNSSPLKDGDLVLMDYAPEYQYYTSDVTRMWPVNGKFTKEQRDLLGFILKYWKALLRQIRPGVTADQIMDEVAAEMKEVFEATKFSKSIHRKAAEGTLTFRGHLSHPVGMAVHDVGNYRVRPLRQGDVFSIDPMLWVPEEKLYVRMEDVVVLTEDGVENFTDFLPSELDDIEKLMKEEGVLQFRRPTPPMK